MPADAKRSIFVWIFIEFSRAARAKHPQWMVNWRQFTTSRREKRIHIGAIQRSGIEQGIETNKNAKEREKKTEHDWPKMKIKKKNKYIQSRVNEFMTTLRRCENNVERVFRCERIFPNTDKIDLSFPFALSGWVRVSSKFKYVCMHILPVIHS